MVRYRNLLDCIESPLVAINKDLQIVYCNAAYARLAGQAVDAIIGQKWLDVLPELVGSNTQDAYMQALETGRMGSVESKVSHRFFIERIYTTPDGLVSVFDDVSAARRFEAVAQELGSKYHEVFDESWDSIFLLDTYTTEILHMNRSACEMFGYSREELARLNIGNLCPEEPPYSGEEFMRWLRMSSDSRSQSMEWRMRDRSGRVFWIEVKSKRVVFEDRTRLMASIRDINPVKLASEKLRHSRDTYEDFFYNASDMIFVHDLGGNLISVNPAAERITGYSVAELVRMNIQELSAGDSLELLRGFQYQRLAPGRHINYELSVVTKWDTCAHLDVSIWPLYVNGKTVAVQGIARSVTRLKEEMTRLTISEQDLKGLVYSLPDATMAIDMEGKVVVWNKAMERLTGIKASDMLGRGNFEYALAFYETRRPIMVDLVLRPEEVRQYYKVIEVDDYTVISEFKTPKLRGEGRNLWGRAMPWYSEDGRLLGAIESLRDVTERHTILQNHKQWLRESEGQGKQLIAALNSLGASVLTYDKNGKINAATEAMASWLGYQKSSQLVGKELKIVLGARAAKKLLNSQPNIDSLEWICKDGSKMTAAVEVQNIPHESQFSGGMIRIL